VSGLGITNPTEVYFKDGLWGWLTDQWQKLLVNASHHLKVEIASQDGNIAVTESAPFDGVLQAHGWDGAAWRKLPLLWGYSDAYHEYHFNTNLSGGSAIILGDTGVSGEVRVITHFSGYGISETMSRISLGIHTGVAYCVLHSEAFAGDYLTIDLCSEIVIKSNEKLFVMFDGATAEDDGFFIARGYTMKVEE